MLVNWVNLIDQYIGTVDVQTKSEGFQFYSLENSEVVPSFKAQAMPCWSFQAKDPKTAADIPDIQRGTKGTMRQRLFGSCWKMNPFNPKHLQPSQRNKERFCCWSSDGNCVFHQNSWVFGEQRATSAPKSLVCGSSCHLQMRCPKHCKPKPTPRTA